MSEWFYTRRVAPELWLVAEPQHVYCWLVEGAERAVLLDTGLGFKPIRPVVEALTSKPVSIVNTHYHFDHIGGNHEFDEIAIHQLGAPLIECEVPREILGAYFDYAERQLEAAEAYRPLDQEFFWLLSAESDPRPVPWGFQSSTWTVRPSKATTTLMDGDRLDLGGRTLTVLHTPGHSPDSVSLLDEKSGWLFAGDVFNAGPVYAHFPDSDVAELAASARRLSALAGEVSLIMVHHYGRPLAEPDLLREFADGLERVEAGTAELVSGHDIFGDRVLEARFDHFAVVLPHPEGPRRSLA